MPVSSISIWYMYMMCLVWVLQLCKVLCVGVLVLFVLRPFSGRPFPLPVFWSFAICKYRGGRPRRFDHMQLCLEDNVNTDCHSWHQGRFNTKQELLLSTLETISYEFLQGSIIVICCRLVAVAQRQRLIFGVYHGGDSISVCSVGATH